MGNTLTAELAVLPRRSNWGQTLARAYDVHAASVYGLAQRVTGDDEVAAGLTADVFAGLEDVTDDDCLAECVLTDVHRRAVAWVRDATTAASLSPAEESLSALPVGEREVITAAYFDGLTYGDIARRYGFEVSEVVAYMQQGLRRLAALTPAVPAR